MRKAIVAANAGDGYVYGGLGKYLIKNTASLANN